MTAKSPNMISDAKAQIQAAGSREMAGWLSMALVTSDTIEELEDWLVKYNDGPQAERIAKIVRGWITHN